MAVFLTGDTHGAEDFGKVRDFSEVAGDLTRSDYLVILGDFGLVWHFPATSEERDLLAWLNNCPWTTLFLDGTGLTRYGGEAFPWRCPSWIYPHMLPKTPHSCRIGCILTMVGTGSEMNGGAVITNHEAKLKIGPVFGDEVMPKFAILNPRVTFSLPDRGRSLLLFKPEKEMQIDFDEVRAKQDALGAVTVTEKRTVFWIAVAIILWLTESMTGLNVGFVTLFIGAIMASCTTNNRVALPSAPWTTADR